MILASVFLGLRLAARMLRAAARVPFTIIATAVAFTAFAGPDPAALPMRLIDWVQQWALSAPAVADVAAEPFSPDAVERADP